MPFSKRMLSSHCQLQVGECLMIFLHVGCEFLLAAAVKSAVGPACTRLKLGKKREVWVSCVCAGACGNTVNSVCNLPACHPKMPSQHCEAEALTQTLAYLAERFTTQPSKCTSGVCTRVLFVVRSTFLEVWHAPPGKCVSDLPTAWW